MMYEAPLQDLVSANCTRLGGALSCCLAATQWLKVVEAILSHDLPCAHELIQPRLLVASEIKHSVDGWTFWVSEVTTINVVVPLTVAAEL
eukprot:1662176-Amphidinium_carterae.1